MAMESTGRRALIKEFITFNIVGILNTAIDFVVFSLLIWLSVHYAFAQILAFAAGMTNSYLLNSRLTFAASQGGEKNYSQLRRFLLWNGLMLILSIGFLAVMTDVVGLGEIWAKGALIAVAVFVNYYGSRRWVFKRKERGEE